MKQKINVKDIVYKKYNKTLRIMKISIVLIFISTFYLLAESGFSQDKEISLKLANVYTQFDAKVSLSLFAISH